MKNDELTEGFYWIRIHDHIEISSAWQVGWYHVAKTNITVAVWSVCGTEMTYLHGADVEVGVRMEPPTVSPKIYVVLEGGGSDEALMGVFSTHTAAERWIIGKGSCSCSVHEMALDPATSEYKDVNT